MLLLVALRNFIKCLLKNAQLSFFYKYLVRPLKDVNKAIDSKFRSLPRLANATNDSLQYFILLLEPFSNGLSGLARQSPVFSFRSQKLASDSPNFSAPLAPAIPGPPSIKKLMIARGAS
jgi:hypothetical protein